LADFFGSAPSSPTKERVFMLHSNYPIEAGAKRSGTSTDAAVSMKKKAPTLRNDVIELLSSLKHLFNGLTADEAAELLCESVLSIRPRFSELVELNMIEDSGMRRKNQSGRAAIVWLAILPNDQAILF
jgi:hypothetical protein